MAADRLIAARVTAETKARLAALAADLGVTETQLVRRYVERIVGDRPDVDAAKKSKRPALERLSPAEIDQVRRTVGRAPEVMVKVLAGGQPTVKGARQRLEYVGREGELALETDAGVRRLYVTSERIWAGYRAIADQLEEQGNRDLSGHVRAFADRIQCPPSQHELERDRVRELHTLRDRAREAHRTR